MNLQFTKVRLYNFGSYHDTTINLQNLGFCLVNGVNNCNSDGAKSNGSGKSTIFSAICFALTGETLSGVSKGLRNMYTDEADSFVELSMLVDGIPYNIIRAPKPKSDLKIFQNDIDVSGKGITESTTKLKSLLPDLTKDLIASTIILGQGNVNKFSTFSPSGRKQLLEALTHSDYQIDDVKTRLQTRLTTLDGQLKTYNNSIIAHNTSINSLQKNIEALQYEITHAVKPDFDAEIDKISKSIDSLNTTNAAIDLQQTGITEQISQANADIHAAESVRSTAQRNMLENYNAVSRQQLTDQLTISSNISRLDSEIKAKKAIKDVCPTCGQKLLNVVKPDTTEDEKILSGLKEQLTAVKAQIQEYTDKKNAYALQIEEVYKKSTADANQKLITLSNEVNKLRAQKQSNVSALLTYNNKLTKLMYDRDSWDKQLALKQAKIEEMSADLAEHKRLLGIVNVAMADVVEHQAVLKKIDTLVKRDFRSYLLSDIVAYINQRAKDYSSIVFNTRDLDVSINGNDLNITYKNKNFDNLSGGEKQRCDIILQFAIRDLLQSYLGYSSNIIVLDEVFDALDSASTERVISLIQSELRSVESVFIVSHHASELGISADMELNIVKNTDGISEVA